MLYNQKRGDVQLTQLQMMCAALEFVLNRHPAASVGSTLAPSATPQVLGLNAFPSDTTASKSRPADYGNNWMDYVICGDISATPGSQLVDFLLKGYLHFEGLWREQMDGQETENYSLAKREEKAPTFQLLEGMQCYNQRDNVPPPGPSPPQTPAPYAVYHNLTLRSAYPAFRSRGVAEANRLDPICTHYHSSFLGQVDYIFYSPGLMVKSLLEPPATDVLRLTKGLPSATHPSDHLMVAAKFVRIPNGKAA